MSSRVARAIIADYEATLQARYAHSAYIGALADRTAEGIAPIDPAELLALFAADRYAAWAKIGAMTEAQRINQAIETAAHLNLRPDAAEVRWADILKHWEVALQEKGML
jgi:hypothetical protein